MEVKILHLVEGAREAKGVTVIIDVFRAFTVETYLMRGGAEKIIPVGDVRAAWDYKAAHPDAILCGERGGAIIEGFDYGNSPSQVEHVDFTGKTVIHTTSAGTQGIANATGADEIIAGNLVAAKAIATYIRKKNPEHVSLVCMGLAGERCTDEDELAGAYIKSLIEGKPLDNMEARIAALAETDGKKFFDPAQQSVFPQRDFELCVMVDTCPFILRLKNDPESGLAYMERIDVPESIDITPHSTLGQYSRDQVLCFPDWAKAQVVYGNYRAPEGNFDAAIVLGGPARVMESRAKAASELYHAGRCNCFITTGGVPKEGLTEAQWLKKYLLEFGVPESCILTEEQATTTRENYKFTKPILETHFGDRKLRLVTVSCYSHIRRAVKLAEAYIPEHELLGYRAFNPLDDPAHFTEDPAVYKGVTTSFRCLWRYIREGLIDDFPVFP